MLKDSALVSTLTVTHAPEAQGVDAPVLGRRGRTAAMAAEAAVAVLAAGLMVLLSLSIEVNPLVRVGQVSGLAGLGLRFALLGLLAIAGVMLLRRKNSERVRDLATRLGCAVPAGLSSGLVAGGIVVALRGTSLPLNAHSGDTKVLAQWAESIVNGSSNLPDFYPPLYVHAVAWWSSVIDAPVSFAMKDLQIGLTALFGPLAYLAWRLIFRPIPALVIGVTAALPLLFPYKPYEHLVLVVLIPVLVKLLMLLRASADRSISRIVLTGLGFGCLLGVLFLTYSGWFMWAASGFLVAAAIMFPWRSGALRASLLAGITAVAFFVVSAVHLVPLLSSVSTSAMSDTFFYFDTFTDPTYIAMWRTDLPGDVALWPPPGELGGVGVFTILLVIGLATALTLGHRHPLVLTLACCLAGSWLLRFWAASQMFSDQDVRLYPRSTQFIYYCLLLLALVAGYLVLQRVRSALPALELNADAGKGRSAGLLGALAGMLLLLGSIGSATADKYMPRNDESLGKLAWTSHTERMPNGECSSFLLDNCRTVASEYEVRGGLK